MELYALLYLAEPSSRFLHLLWLVSRVDGPLTVYIYPSSLKPRDDAATCKLYILRRRK